MSESTSEQRKNWKQFECAEHLMTTIAFGPDSIGVAPPTVEAWRALASVFEAHHYQIRTEDTDSYNCRQITGGTGRSLHSYGIALDVNWTTNPYKETPDKRLIRFSNAPTQAARGQEVKRNLADTDMTKDMIEDALRIKTIAGKRVFEWGGNWKSVKDAMHFEIDVTPDDLKSGIDWSTVSRPAEPSSEASSPILDFPPPVPIGEALGNIGMFVEELASGSRGDNVVALQQALTRLNYHLGEVDGVFGPLTQAMVLAFQADNDLPTTGVVDATTQAALLVGKPRPLSGERVFETVDDLRAKGSKVVELADWLQKLGIGTGILGALGLSEGQISLVSRILGRLVVPAQGPPVPPPVPATPEAAGNIFDGLGPIVGPLLNVAQGVFGTQSGLGALAVGAGVLLWRNAQQIKTRRLDEHQSGANLDK